MAQRHDCNTDSSRPHIRHAGGALASMPMLLRSAQHHMHSRVNGEAEGQHA